jgi:hypothetical protein
MWPNCGQLSRYDQAPSSTGKEELHVLRKSCRLLISQPVSHVSICPRDIREHLLSGIQKLTLYCREIKYYKTWFLWCTANHSFTKSPWSPHELLSSVTEHRQIFLRLSGCVVCVCVCVGRDNSGSKCWLCLKVHSALKHNHRFTYTISAKPENSTSIISKPAIR